MGHQGETLGQLKLHSQIQSRLLSTTAAYANNIESEHSPSNASVALIGN